MRHLMFAAAALTLAAAPAFANQPSIVGDWSTQGGKAKVRIAECGAQVCGTIVSLAEPNGEDGKPKRDARNANTALRGRPIVGLPMLSGFTSGGDGRWTGGKIYDPESGKTYNSKMTLNPNGTLKVEGCVSVICKGQTWTRAR